MSRKRNVTVAAVQMKCSTNVEENIAKADALVREAAEKEHRSSFCRSFLKDSIFVRNADMNTMNLQKK